MRSADHQQPSVQRRRLYVVHLLAAPEQDCAGCRYIARIRPWAVRGSETTARCERAFADECDLIATINPLLPRGSDVRDVFEHVESDSGFFYLLRLSDSQAQLLGWSTAR